MQPKGMAVIAQLAKKSAKRRSHATKNRGTVEEIEALSRSVDAAQLAWNTDEREFDRFQGALAKRKDSTMLNSPNGSTRLQTRAKTL